MAVSFLLIARNSLPQESAKPEYWRETGKQLHYNYYKIVAVVVLPLLAMALTLLDKEMSVLLLPIATMAVMAIFLKQGKQ